MGGVCTAGGLARFKLQPVSWLGLGVAREFVQSHGQPVGGGRLRRLVVTVAHSGQHGLKLDHRLGLAIHRRQGVGQAVANGQQVRVRSRPHGQDFESALEQRNGLGRLARLDKREGQLCPRGTQAVPIRRMMLRDPQPFAQMGLVVGECPTLKPDRSRHPGMARRHARIIGSIGDPFQRQQKANGGLDLDPVLRLDCRGRPGIERQHLGRGLRCRPKTLGVLRRSRECRSQKPQTYGDQHPPDAHEKAPGAERRGPSCILGVACATHGS